MGLTDKRQTAKNITDYRQNEEQLNYRLATKTLTEIYRKTTKVENFNRQCNAILTLPHPIQTLYHYAFTKLMSVISELHLADTKTKMCFMHGVGT